MGMADRQDLQFLLGRHDGEPGGAANGKTEQTDSDGVRRAEHPSSADDPTTGAGGFGDLVSGRFGDPLGAGDSYDLLNKVMATMGPMLSADAIWAPPWGTSQG